MGSQVLHIHQQNRQNHNSNKSKIEGHHGSSTSKHHRHRAGKCSLLVISAEDLSAFAEMLISRTRQIVEQEYNAQFYDVKELAHLLHVTQTTVYNMAKRGTLKPVKVGKRTVFKRTTVEDAISRGLLGKYVHKY